MSAVPGAARAQAGAAGGPNGKSGGNAEEYVVEVPLGTIVRILPHLGARNAEVRFSYRESKL